MAKEKAKAEDTQIETPEIENPETPEVVEAAGEKKEQPSEVVSEQDVAEEFERQLAAVKQAEEAARARAEQAERDRQENLRLLQERDQEIVKLRTGETQSRYDAVVAALAAAKAESDAAERDIENARINDDHKLQIDAYRRLARAEANIAKLEDGRIELEELIKNPPKVETRQPAQTTGDQLDRLNIPDRAKAWLRQHPDYMTDARKNAKIQSLHWDVLDEGHPAFSEAYFDSLEKHLGMRRPDPDAGSTREATVVSAPVSRSAPSVSSTPRNGRVTLTAEQKEAARIAGVSEVDYAKNLLRLRNEKANGHYGGQQ